MDSQIKLCSLGISCYCNVIVIHMGVLGEHPKIWWLIITFPVRKTNWNDKLPTVSQQLQNSNVDALDRPCPPASRFTLRRLNMTGWCFHSFTQCVLLCFTLFYYGLPCFACGHDWLWYIMVNYQWLELWLWFMVALVVVMAWNEKIKRCISMVKPRCIWLPTNSNKKRAGMTIPVLVRNVSAMFRPPKTATALVLFDVGSTHFLQPIANS